MNEHTRGDIAALMVARIERDLPDLVAKWAKAAPVRHLVIDDLLPTDLAERVAAQFPPIESMMLKSSIRERKRVGVDVGAYAPVVTETLYAFQDPRVIDAVRRATGIGDMAPDASLYAAGLSAMGEGDFLNPHLDNSHDGDGRYYRAINVLYYVSPGWQAEHGGNLELWEPTVRQQETVWARFNRLVVMATDQTSWHSVSPIQGARSRYCVSNYYFTQGPPGGTDYRHVTTFTGRPEQPLTRATLAVVDGVVLNTIAKLVPSLVKRNRHRIRPEGM